MLEVSSFTSSKGTTTYFLTLKLKKEKIRICREGRQPLTTIVDELYRMMNVKVVDRSRAKNDQKNFSREPVE
jgi:hypothetical protein